MKQRFGTSQSAGLRALRSVANKIALAVFCLALGQVSIQNANAQCPSLNALTGGGTTWWAFQLSDGLDQTDAIGIFAATVQPPSAINPFSTGVLIGTESWNNAGNSINVRAGFTGRFTVDANDCSRGTISFNVNSNNYQFTFVLADTPAAAAPFGAPSALSPNAKLLMVTSNQMPLNTGAGQFLGERGIAYLLPGPPTCRNAADPLAQLDGSSWSLLGTDAFISSDIAIFSATEVAASSTNPFARGTLRGNKSVSGSFFQSTQEDFTGTYQIYGPDLNGDGANCSGGQLFLSGNGSAYQYDFVFAPPFDGNGARRMLGLVTNVMVPNGNQIGLTILTPFGSFPGTTTNHMQAFKNTP